MSVWFFCDVLRPECQNYDGSKTLRKIRFVVYQLGDEELCRVYHAEFFAWYAQRAMVKGWLPASLSALEALYPARLAEV